MIDSAGHLAGHINGLVRIGPNKFVHLANDSCHVTSLLSGECQIAVWKNEMGELTCVHSDKEKAEAYIQRIR